MVLALLSTPAHAWGHHYLVTARALESPAATEVASRTVRVESLEHFLAAEMPALEKTFGEYYDGLEGTKRFARMTLDEPTREAFLRAARLNPRATVALVVRHLPGETAGVEPLASISPYLKDTPPFLFSFDAVSEGQSLEARQVIWTASDEPDWGFDHELWPFAEYGYGEQPYGKPTGESSKAPFHMQFAHENFLVRKAAPEVLEGMVVERMELFARLAKTAFATGHPYWGYRFAGWAIHYGEDLGQPYHAKALPGAGFWYYVKFVFSFHKAEMKKEATQIAGNRHFLYEDFVAYGLQQSWLAPAPMFTQLAQFLAGPDAIGGADVRSIADSVMDASAKHARVIDKAIRQAFGPHLTEDPGYDVETAPDYDVPEAIAAMDPGGRRDAPRRDGTGLRAHRRDRPRDPRAGRRRLGSRRRRSAAGRGTARRRGHAVTRRALGPRRARRLPRDVRGRRGGRVQPRHTARRGVELRMAGRTHRARAPRASRRSRLRRRIPPRDAPRATRGGTSDRRRHEPCRARSGGATPLECATCVSSKRTRPARAFLPRPRTPWCRTWRSC